jgi:DNA-binding NtrC family response regulator
MQVSTALLNGSVLIVDDDTEALEEMADALHGCGLAVHTARNEVMALNLSNEHRPQIIIMDYLLRGYCGLDAIKTIRTFLPETQVIMVSAHEDLFSVMKTINHADSGVIAVLKKPLSIDRVGIFVRKTLERRLKALGFESHNTRASLHHKGGPN